MDTTTHDPELAEAYQDAKAVLLELARKDVNAFIEYVMRDERTGALIEQARTHLKMQTACDEHDRLILWSHVEAGKTAQIAVARVLFILGSVPGATVGIISDTHEQAAKIVRIIAKYIENSEEYAEVFPHVKRGEPWTSHHLYLEPIPGRIAPKDPSVQACGIGGNITGSRISHMIWDDVLDMDNTSNVNRRNTVYNWLKSAEVMGRLLEGAPLWCIGNAYHPDDALHRLAREPLWHFLRLPVEDEKGRPTWPERWSAARIARKRLDAGPLEFARQMMCVARDDSESRFKREDLDACCARGRGVPWIRSVSDLLASPWPLPSGALAALPAPKPTPMGAHDDDVADAAMRLETSRRRAWLRGRGRVQPGADATRKALARGVVSQGAGGVDAARLFPDTPHLASTAHAREAIVPSPDDLPVDAPSWLMRRQAQERIRTSREVRKVGLRRGEVAPSACAAGAPGALVTSQNVTTLTALPHIVHTPHGAPESTDCAPVCELNDVMANILAIETVEQDGGLPGPMPKSGQPQAVLAGGRDGGELEVGAGDVVGGHAGVSSVLGGLQATGATLAHARPALLLDDEKMATPVLSRGSVDHGSENLPSRVDLAGPIPEHASAIATRPPGAPEGVEVSLDSYAWLGAWLGDPGTPHRNDAGWPIHPRSLSALKRMGIELFTGVDLAVQKHSSADFTVLYTIAVYPPDANGHRARRVLEIQRGKWYALDICKRIIDVHDRFGSTVFVENVAAQDYIRQMIMDGFERPDAGQWLFGYTTGRNKANPEFGIEHLAAELAREQWIFPVPATWTPASPDVAPELEQNFNEVLYFDPKEHTGDVLMAMWLAKEAARMTSVDHKPAEVGVRAFA